jgi:hypothetical protein
MVGIAVSRFDFAREFQMDLRGLTFRHLKEAHLKIGWPPREAQVQECFVCVCMGGLAQCVTDPLLYWL